VSTTTGVVVDNHIEKIIEKVLRAGDLRAMEITPSGFLSSRPPVEDMAKDIIQALEEAGYAITKDTQQYAAPVETKNLT